MAWIAAIAILYFLIIYKGFRRVFGYFILILIISGALIWRYQIHKEELSKKRISASELFFEDVSLRNSGYGNYVMDGRITNNSDKYALTELELKLTFEDCEKTQIVNVIGYGEVEFPDDMTKEEMEVAIKKGISSRQLKPIEEQRKLSHSRPASGNLAKNCIVISEGHEHMYINIPPKQARDFEETLGSYSRLKFKGKLRWNYSIESITAE